MKIPDYSIIVPVYNANKTIKNLVRSITDHNFKDIEIILVNDGSKDDSLKIIKELSKQDSRIVVVDQSNKGPSSARNQGLAKSTGKFVIFCDADDEIISKNFESILQKYSKTDADLITLGWNIIQKNKNNEIVSKRSIYQQKETIIGNKNIIQKSLKSFSENGRMYNLWNRIYNADIIRRHSLKLRDDLKLGEDVLFNFNFLKHSDKIKFSSLQPYYTYEENSPTSIVSSSRLEYKFWQENFKALDDFSKLLENNLYAEDINNLIKWRWLISYSLSVTKSKKTITNQIRLISEIIKDQKLKPKNKSKKISRQKMIVQIIFYLLSFIPLLFWLIIKISAWGKNKLKSKNKTILLTKF